MPEHTIAENLQRLVDAKENIGKAITAKGGIVNYTDGLEEYPNDISTIKNELTSININENGTYSNSIEDTISTNNYPIIINADGDNIKSITIAGNSNQASTPTPTNPVDVSGVGVMSSNLIEKIIEDATIDSNGRIASSDYNVGIAKVGNGVTYTVNSGVLAYYNSIPTINSVSYDGQRILLNDTVPNTIIAPIDGYIAFRLPKSRNGMINKGSQPLPYEPYGYKIPVLSNLQTNNIYLNDVQTVRQIKKLVLTGQESWESSSTSEQRQVCYLIKDDIKLDVTGKSTHINWKSTYDADEYNRIVVARSGNHTLLYLSLDITYVGSTLATFKQYLQQQYAAGTPVTIWYVLANETTGITNEPLMKIADYSDTLTLTNTTIKTISGNNTIDYNLITKPSNTSITYNKININKTITSDTLPIEFESTGDDATVVLNGQSNQASTPTPSSPVDVNGVGDRTGNLWNNGDTWENVNTDTRAFFQPDIALFDGNTKVGDNVRIDVKSNGYKYLVSITPNTSFTRVSVKHNGSTKDLPLGSVYGEFEANVPVTISFIVNGFDPTTIGGISISNIMLNTGSTALPYEPYGYKISILINNNTINKYLGTEQTERQIKKYEFTGQEEWSISNNERVLYTALADHLTSNELICYCSHYKSIANVSAMSALSNGECTFNNTLRWFYIKDDNYNDAVTFKTYLQQQYAAGTPVCVWYILAESTTGITDEPLMKIGSYSDTLSTSIPTIEGENTLNINTTIKPSLTSITYTDLNTIGYDEIIVNVPNTYTVSDEGKVVNSGTLVAQTAYPTEITANDTYDTTLYNSIVVNVPTGGSAGKSDVNFYDYDGTIVTSYTKDEFANLTALPANPTHEGLTAQSWNWSLADAKTYVNKYGKLDIGQMYVTSDGKTRLRIRLGYGRLKPYLGLTGNSSGTAVSIDWGDGSATESVTLNTSTVYTPHEYSTSGDYTISVTVTSGSITLTGDTSKYSNILRKSTSPNANNDMVYQNSLIGIEIGDNVTSIGDNVFYYCASLQSITIPDTVTSIGDNAFRNCFSLISITIPDTVTSIGAYAFYFCSSLISITIPDTVTSIGAYAFYFCYPLTSITIPDTVTSIDERAFYYCASLQSITIPDTVTSIGAYAFNGCSSLTSITIPDTVTSIGSGAFSECYGLGLIKFTSTTPPTVLGSNSWFRVPTDCVIYVPTGTIETYKAASNYPNPSTYTYVEY